MDNLNFLNLEYIIYSIYSFFKDFSVSKITKIFLDNWPVILNTVMFLVFVVFIFLIYLRFKLKKIAKAEEEKFKPYAQSTRELSARGGIDDGVNRRWQQILEKVNSEDGTDWRMAIIDADVILDEMTSKMGYTGESLGERLRSIEKSDFNTIDLAWEAHKVRNAIAHEGANYQITQREAKRVIDLYSQVFKEFYFI